MLSDKRVVTASPKHPTADYKLLTDIKLGDKLDNATVVGIEVVSYGNNKTYDILVDSPQSTYWSDGVKLGSTLWQI
jgi:hypothetical protein